MDKEIKDNAPDPKLDFWARGAALKGCFLFVFPFLRSEKQISDTSPLPDTMAQTENGLEEPSPRATNAVMKEALSSNPNKLFTLDKDGYTPLMQMVKTDNLEMVKWIIENHPQTVTIQTKHGKSTPLMHAAKSKQTNSSDILEALLKGLLTLAPEDVKKTYNATDISGMTFTSYWNSLKGKVPETLDKQWIAAEAIATPPLAKPNTDNLVNTKDDEGGTPLMLEIKRNNVDGVKSLLSNREINLAAKDDNGDTTLNYAVKSSNADILKALLRTLPKDTAVEIYDASEVESFRSRNGTIMTEWYRAHKKGEDIELDTLLEKIDKLANPPEFHALEKERDNTKETIDPVRIRGKQNEILMRQKALGGQSPAAPPQLAKSSALTTQKQGAVTNNPKEALKPAIGGPKKNKKSVQFTTTISVHDPKSPDPKSETTEKINTNPRKLRN